MADSREVSRRLDVVEETIREHGWSGAVCRKLATQLGVNERTVRGYRQRVVQEQAAAYQSLSPEEDRAEFLTDLMRQIRGAEKDRKWGSVFGGMAIRAKVMGIEAPTRLEIVSRQDEGEQKARGLWRRRSLEQSDDVIDVEAEVVESEGQAVALIESG